MIHHGRYLWNLISSLKLRLHANIFSFKVASSHIFSKYSESNRTTSFLWSCLSTFSGSASVSVGFLTHALFFFCCQQRLPTHTTQVIGSKVLYTEKYYINVDRFLLTRHRPKFIHITQEKALFKRHLF